MNKSFTHNQSVMNSIKDLSGKNYRFDGENEGVINGQPYHSTTEGVFGEDGTLRCSFIYHKLPTGFVAQYLSLSNASSKSSNLAIPKDVSSKKFFSIMGGGWHS